MKIDKYEVEKAGLKSYNPVYTEAAKNLMDFIKNEIPEINIHHVGSTSIPDCDGKGIIDILITFKTKEDLEFIKDKLRQSGFQKQITEDPFPEERPMRTGSFKYNDKAYKTHLHVVPASSREVKELIFFKELLSDNAEIRNQYINIKKEIIAKGITDGLEYSVEKGKFIMKVLNSGYKTKY